ncbi:hypothetical protein EXIGLDRAFT_736759 [Exidia glandulosa HHB12029]|uniref:Uncharacterized protein n=1 Tax=Exidia glandulosa HHB12029 TaxID=1314781 RepID=A0A165PDW6_EXIGL|nr:hypothetical protein EXIGLDRAFT_736759 [Exidia glandulosa HHB12029]
MAAVAPLKLQTSTSSGSRFVPHSPSPLSATASSSDSISSLASSSSSSSLSQSPKSPSSPRPPMPQRTASFPTSRPLRPFASIAHSTYKDPLSSSPAHGRRAQSDARADQPSAARKGAVKLIQPPKVMPVFTLNLTQAEFSRRGY